MINFFKKKFYFFRTNPVLWVSCIFAISLLCFHVYQFIDSGYRIEPLIRIVFYSLCPFVIFFFGEVGIILLISILALMTEQFNDFTNYTSFFLLALIITISCKVQKAVIILIYILDVFIVCQNHDKSAFHLAIHFIGCAWIYLYSEAIIKKVSCKVAKQVKKNKLILTEKEKYILSQLANGAKQKEIDIYSENTVSKILKKCREKNFCSSNSELLTRFLMETIDG